MPHLDVTAWVDEAVAEQVQRLRAAGAEPELTLRWLSASERAQRDQDAEDERRCAALRAQSMRGAAKSYSKSRGR